MSLTTVDIGLTAATGTDITEPIFGGVPSPFKVITATLASATATYVAGQVFALSTVASGVPKYAAVASSAAFLASTAQAGILIESVTQAAAEAIGNLQVSGSFLKASLTPADIPNGAYGNGSIIIAAKETY